MFGTILRLGALIALHSSLGAKTESSSYGRRPCNSPSGDAPIRMAHLWNRVAEAAQNLRNGKNLWNLCNLCEGVLCDAYGVVAWGPWNTRMRQPLRGSSHTCLPSKIGYADNPPNNENLHNVS
jgi:hypothetical protein